MKLLTHCLFLILQDSNNQNVQWSTEVCHIILLSSFIPAVFKSSFLDRYDVDKDTLEQIRNDEIALLKFGITWLKSALFKEDTWAEVATP